MGKTRGKRRRRNTSKNPHSSDGRNGQRKDDATLKERDTVRKQTQTFPVPGLTNLGNTCFFNAVLQNLSQTHLLRQRMDEQLSLSSYCLSIPPGNTGLVPLEVDIKNDDDDKAQMRSFAADFYQFLVNMSGMSSRILNPRIVFNHICKSAPRFSSYQQQDSHELLRYLLDALKNEEVKRRKAAILRSYGVCRKPDNVKTLSDDDRKAIKAYGMQVSLMDTYIEDIFGGKLASSITCHSCQTRTAMQEDILDISLPIPSDKVHNRHPKFKRKVTHHSSDNDEDFASQKEIAHLSKHQKKKQEKAERKKSKGKIKQRYSLKEFSEFQESDISILPRKEISPENSADTHVPTDDTLVKQFSKTSLVDNVTIGNTSAAAGSLVNSPTCKSETPKSALPDEVSHAIASGGHNELDCVTSDVSFRASCESTVNDLPVLGEQSHDCSIPDDVVTKNDAEQDNPLLSKDNSSGIKTIELKPSEVSVGVSESNYDTTSRVEQSYIPDEDDLFSLQSCLRDFTTPEVLKGTEKFCCAVCTEETKKMKSKVIIEEKVKEKCPALPVSFEQEQQQVLEEAAEEAVEEERSHELAYSVDFSKGSSLSSSECEREDFRDVESTKESDDEETDLSDSESECHLVFSEATKQLLVDHPPHILCIHLKRFTQLGKNHCSLQKNNVHINFSFLLDMAPYCTDKCKDYCDSSGKIMYSLYGVVIHGGSMRGGHYTAYVRVRTEIQLDRIRTSNSETETTDNDVIHHEQQQHLFDYSSTENSQWYYISDSHVSKASGDDVLQSQAYLLFYERLPFLLPE